MKPVRHARHNQTRYVVALILLLAGAVLAGAFLPAAPAAAPLPAAGGRDTEPQFQVVFRVPTREKLVALTFDAGSDAGHTQAILEILRDEGVKATFFLTGAWLDQYPELALEVVRRGHELGNHTQTHPHMTGLSDEKVAWELEVTEEKAVRILGRTLKPYFRPPFGEYDRRVASVAAGVGYPYVIMWTVDSLDWKMITPEELTERVVTGARPGGIILMHVGSQTRTPEALPVLIRQLREDGFRLVCLGDLLEAWPENTVLHTVVAGETLSAIAAKYGVTVADILAANDMTDANMVRAGAVLLIPTSEGDTGVGAGSRPPGGDVSTGDPAGGGDGNGSGGAGSDGRAGPGSILDRFRTGLAQTWHRLWSAASVLWSLLVGR